MDRWDWIDAFKNLNLTTAEIMNMSEDEFICRTQFLAEAGLAPHSAYNDAILLNHMTAPKAEENDRSIMIEQDDEYEKALKDDKINEEMDRMNEFREKLHTRIEEETKEEKERIRKANMEKASQLKREGDIQLAFLFPSMKRALHKFSSNSLGEDLFSFVAGEEEMYTEGGSLKEFRLLHGLNHDVKKEFLLDEQNISNRDMIKVICE
jgi:hypothetical protein